jgi:hypothetical protein
VQWIERLASMIDVARTIKRALDPHHIRADTLGRGSCVFCASPDP